MRSRKCEVLFSKVEIRQVMIELGAEENRLNARPQIISEEDLYFTIVFRLCGICVGGSIEAFNMG